ncbi:MAG: class I SAM-dependent methyltransferase [Kofleriaceae bacterium]
MHCRLCGAGATQVARQRLLGTHDVDYFLCPRCELLQTEEPTWLAEAYAAAISQLDTGAVQRNQLCARLTGLVAATLELPAGAPCLDFGGGHGVFVRMMRDLGLDFRWTDKLADNLYAGGFEGDVTAHHALVTAFEVLEHLADVRGDLAQLFGPQPDCVLIGTVLHAGHQPGWWYYLLESGQHVCFYNRRTLAWIGELFGYEVLAGPEYSVFLRRGTAIGALRRRVLAQLVRHPIAAVNLVGLVPGPLLRRLSPYRSRVETDHQAMRAKPR